MGSAAEWLRQERRKTLGDWVAVCLACGHAQRYFDENEAALPTACPACAGEMRHRCPACDARFSSVFAVDCEACSQPLREPEILGMKIRRSEPGTPRRPRRV